MNKLLNMYYAKTDDLKHQRLLDMIAGQVAGQAIVWSVYFLLSYIQ